MKCETAFKRLKERSRFMMMFPVTSTDCLTEDDRRMLVTTHDKDMRDELTPGMPLIAAYPGGWFVWESLDDHDTVGQAIDELAMSDKAKDAFRWFYRDMLNTKLPGPVGFVLALRFDDHHITYQEECQ